MGQNNLNLCGRIELKYIKDTIYKRFYWEQSRVFVNKNSIYHVIKDFDELDFLNIDNCNLDKKNYISRRTLYEVSHFEDSRVKKESDDFNYHYGGDIYEKSDTIIVSFNLSADVLLFNKDTCNYLFTNSGYSCPVDKPVVSFPLIVLVDIKSAKKLSKREQKELKFKKRTIKKFPFNECD